LNLLQDLVVLVVTTETDSQTFGTESTGSGNSVQVSIRVFWHVVVENDVHSFDIDTSSEEIGGDQDSSLKVFEQRVSFKSFLLVHGPVDVDGWEVLVFEELVQGDASLNGFDEDDDLVEFERVEEVEQFSVLLLFFELTVVLSETVEGELGVVVNVDLHWVGHELFADWSHFFWEGGGEHHNLLLMWSRLENILNISSHIQLLQHFITLVQNKVFGVFQVELAASDQSQDPTWGTDNNMWGVFPQGFPVVLDWHTSEEDSHFNIVQVLAESLVFFWDLESEFSGVAENDGGNLAIDWLDLLKGGEHEDLKNLVKC